MADDSLTFTISAVEIYFENCFDLLNNKAKVPIKGYGSKKAGKIVTNIYEDFNNKGPEIIEA